MKYSSVWALLLLCVPFITYSMEEQTTNKTPMDNDWFENKDHPYATADEFIQKREWPLAEEEYAQLLEKKEGTSYDQQLAQLNKASAQFAQGNSSEGWKVYDEIKGSTENRLENINALSAQNTIVVNTNDVGIGDIFHFLKAAEKLQKQTSAKVTLSTKGFLHSALKGASKAYNFTLANSAQTKEEDYSFSTHLISLLGHLEMSPDQLKPEKVVLTVQEKAFDKVEQLLAPHRTKKIGVIFLGENREAIVMGGKKLKHRHLDAAAFENLLKEHSDLILIDCNPKQSRISFASSASPSHLNMKPAYAERIMPLPDEENAFDTTVAMGLIANQLGTRYYGFASDNGPANVYERALTGNAQQRTAIIIPDTDDYDMRMEGAGSSYTQLLSDCRVYKSSGQEQSEVIMGAFNDMTE